MKTPTESIENLHISECVTFNPVGEKAALIKKNLAYTPRYLFHVYDCKTKSVTDNVWVKSWDASRNDKDHKLDVFGRKNRGEVARGLNEHLRWSPTTSGKDNFVSWTSSLLFAITYAIYRHNFKDLRTPLDQISLCIVDTSQLQSGVFINDMDLMEAYSNELPSDEEIHIYLKGVSQIRRWDHRGLPNLVNLRKKHWGGAYNYFGEYLSQGKLRIEGACAIIACDRMINWPPL